MNIAADDEPGVPANHSATDAATGLRQAAAPIRVLLADDQPLLRMGFRLILEGEGDLDVIGEAADGAEAVALVARLQPDIVLMDVRMPVLDGIAATRSIVESGSTARIIILTTFDLDEYAFTGSQAGASGFLLKDTEPADLIAAVRLVNSGDAVIAPRVTRRLLETFLRPSSGGGAPADKAMIRNDPLLQQLTPRELEVLGVVAAGLSNSEIARKLVVSETTVKSHVGHILTKLQLRDRVQAVIYAYETGVVTPS